jgi:hypothetical protein
MIVLMHRRRHPLPVRVGFLGHYVGTVAFLLLPICALLSVTTLSLVIPSARRAAVRLEASQKRITQGDVRYFHLEAVTKFGRP